MRFLIDADLPRDTASLIASYGHVATDVRDIGLGSASDDAIAAHARTNGMCIVTADWGFANIRVYRPQEYSGIVVLGLPPHATGPEILSVLAFLLGHPEVVELLPGRLAVVEKQRIRLRPRPEAKDSP